MYIKLQLIGKNIDLDSITQLIGITPTFTCKEGDISTTRIGKREVKAINDSWIYDVEADEFTEKLIKDFLDNFLTCSEIFMNMRKNDITPYLVITHYIDNYQTIISLPYNVVKLIAQLHLELCIDIMSLETLY